MGSRSRIQSHEGSCPLHCPCLTRDSLWQPPSSRPLNQTHNTQWQRVQDQKKPRRVAPMYLLSSPRDKSKNSKRPLVSWMLTRTVSCLALTLSLPSLEYENLFLMVRHQACSLRHLVQLTLHRWSCFSQKKWPEAPMMTIPSLKLDSFEINGKIDAEMFKHSLCTFGDKFTASEVDNAYSEFIIEDGMIDAAHLKGLMVSKKEEGEE